MGKHETLPNPFNTVDTLDEVLLDVATLIELSPRDRRVADNRYRMLKEHLEREGSPLAAYLKDGVSLIYAQGSIAASTTIVSGTNDDRFDVDAIVEIDVPAHWSNSQALDLLEEALQGFPGAIKIVRCTRCVQIQFAFMHMDVTILDRSQRIAIERAGAIFHSPDEGDSYRVPSNPWGFTGWFRSKVRIDQQAFFESLAKHREATSRNRLLPTENELVVLAKADQHPLPPMIPNALDAQEAVALKLLKRFINLRYEGLSIRQPPSIYLTKRTGDLGWVGDGLAVQLFALADSTAQIMRGHLKAGTRPAEVNPSYREDRINDRWPAEGVEGQRQMKACAEALEHLCARLEHMATAPLADIAKLVDELFGERIGKQAREVLAKRYDRRTEATPILSTPRTGGIYAPAVVPATASAREVKPHHFHAEILRDGDDDD